jgi:3-deoxy-D-manno-octulosonic-acid transferase
VWLHGSSAGNVKALLPLADLLHATGLPVCVSCVTSSGATVAEGSTHAAVMNRAPLDWAPIVARALQRLAPRLLVLERLEMWPALVSRALRSGIPVMVVNGQLSARSLRRYRRFAWLFRPIFEGVHAVLALDQPSAERFAEAGVAPERIVVTSSTKHAILPELRQPSSLESQTIVLGSLHRAEAKLIFPQLLRLTRLRPDLRIIVAPRRAARAPWFRRRLEALGLRVCYRSECKASACRVVVHDRFGDLVHDYPSASVAFVGGSLVARGGHNVIEPASRGVPVLVGPHVDSCRAEVEALGKVDACRVVRDGAGFAEEVERALTDRTRNVTRGRAARVVAEELAHGGRLTLRRVLTEALCTAAAPPPLGRSRGDVVRP